ncbi:MAG: TatD family hydrolase [Pseudomonadota bacterium]|nr:TatD family hydrolase [Pseudomonadota bacterium]
MPSMMDTPAYVDVHTHLTHELFSTDLTAVIAAAETAGLRHIVVNGLHPTSNRIILAMAAKFPIVHAALGIYPVEAVADLLPADFSYEVEKFSVADELAFIATQAKSGKLIAIGECGLDGYLVGEETFAAQERVFLRLCEIATDCNLPIIIHSRKRERRIAEVVIHHGIKRVNFHCFCGKVKLAKRLAEEHGFWFSIPANSRVNQGFQRMMAELPLEKILTETDAPYLAPVRGERNEPKNVVHTVEHLASIRNMSQQQACEQVYRNFLELMGMPSTA